MGIGGAYLCIYGMEGPGGYQFVGRTVPVWSRHRPFRQTTPERPWLLRFFDQIRFHPVGAAELLDLRADMVAGRGEVRVEETVFDVAGYRAWLAANDDDIATFRTRQRAAFAEERARWEASGELRRASELAEATDDGGALAAGGPAVDAPPGAALVVAPFAAKVGDVSVAEGDDVEAGDRVAVLEAMKMEVSVPADRAGRVTWVGCRPGQLVTAGQPLVGVEPAGAERGPEASRPCATKWRFGHWSPEGAPVTAGLDAALASLTRCAPGWRPGRGRRSTSSRPCSSAAVAGRRRPGSTTCRPTTSGPRRAVWPTRAPPTGRCGASRSRSRATSTSPACPRRPPARRTPPDRPPPTPPSSPAWRPPGPSRSAPPTSTSSPPGSSAPARPTAPATPSATPAGCRADRARGRRWSSPRATCRSPSAPTPRGRAGCRPRSTASPR